MKSKIKFVEVRYSEDHRYGNYIFVSEHGQYFLWNTRSDIGDKFIGYFGVGLYDKYSDNDNCCNCNQINISLMNGTNATITLIKKLRIGR